METILVIEQAIIIAGVVLVFWLCWDSLRDLYRVWRSQLNGIRGLLATERLITAFIMGFFQWIVIQGTFDPPNVRLVFGSLMLAWATEKRIFRMMILSRAAEQSKWANAAFQGLIDASPDGTIIADASGRMAFMNTRAEKLFGYRQNELLGQQVEILIPDRFRDAHRAGWIKYFNNPRVREFNRELHLYALRKDGTEFPVEINLSPLHTKEGLLVSSTIRQVTELSS